MKKNTAMFKIPLLFSCLLCTSYLHATELKLSQENGSRFLLQSTLGFDSKMLEALLHTGRETWIEQQLQKKPTKIEPYLIALRVRQENSPTSARFEHQKLKNKSAKSVGKRNLSTAWLRAVLNGEDALRQKVAWALSQIFVVSNESTGRTLAAANYYDLILDQSFSNFYELLYSVTFHPMMGHYLSYLGNTKANKSKNIYPDENYAREVMQLFTIGLSQLNDDGTFTLDNKQQRIPTYNITDIENGARVFTGFQLAKATPGSTRWDRYREPMTLDNAQHDKERKSFFGGQLVLPAGNSAKKDIEAFLLALAKHPNTAPFISRRLIQHLTTSNPSPAYMRRVTSRWLQTQGNLGEVVTAILLDPEAIISPPNNHGKLKDPISRVVQVIKAFECFDPNEITSEAYPGLQWWNPSVLNLIGQEPMKAPSVFNFFEPDYSKPGFLKENGIYSPEFQILDEVTSIEFSNYLWQGLTSGFHRGRKKHGTSNSVQCNLTKLESARSLQSFLDYCNLMLTGGKLDKAALKRAASQAASLRRVKQQLPFMALVIATSPESAILR